MIQRTAIWILATFALCSPGAVTFERAVGPLGSSYVVWSVHAGSEESETTVSRAPIFRFIASSEPSPVFGEHESSLIDHLPFGSLYNRPPPASLSFS